MVTLSSVLALSVVVALGANALPTPDATGETHKVTLINKCSSGTPVFAHGNSTEKFGSMTQTGPLPAAVAWLDDFDGADCKQSGVNCGIVEFSLINPTSISGNSFNSINYSLLKGPGKNHQLTYAMDFEYTGSCASELNPGACVGDSPEQCPRGYFEYDPNSGKPVTCKGENSGVIITFCADPR